MKRYLRWYATGLLALAGAGLIVAELHAQAASQVSGEAFAAYASVTGNMQKTGSALLPSGGGMDAVDLDAWTVGPVTGGWSSAISTGAIDARALTSQSTAAVENVDILGGLITADLVLAVASSAQNNTLTESNAVGSVLTGLVIGGVSYGSGDLTPAPNTRVSLPGVGYVVLNEQIHHGDGGTSTGLTVNMIHVVLQDALTGVTTGEIIVGSASSALN